VVARAERIAALLVGTLLFAVDARADPPAPAEPAAKPDEQKLSEAKELFKQGNSLRAAGDVERALDFYLRSRALVASVPNTLNAALCLDQLGRFDEALDLYEELLTRFAGELSDEDRQAIGPAMTALKRRLGSLDVAANVSGALLVDGRARGTLPLTSALPVIPGEHLVRIVKDGYDTFEKRISIRAGERQLVDAKLRRLAHAGKLRVDAHGELAGADLFVDGGMVGKLPWEGTLTPGTHLYHVRRADLGTAPARAIVVEGQTVLVDAAPKPLGPELRVVVEPRTADFFVNGVPLGKGGWQGRLPLGTYSLEAREDGYHPETLSRSIAPDSAGRISLKLQVDPDHPRWSAGKAGHLWIALSGGPAFASSVGSDANLDCDAGRCTDHGAALGAMVGVRGGYEFPMGISVELYGGVLALSESLTRKRDAEFGREGGVTSTSYAYSDRIRMAGPFVSAGVGYRRTLGGRFGASGHVHLGAAFPSSRDEVSAEASALGRTVPAEVQGSGTSVRSAAVFAMPEVVATLRFGHLEIGAGLGVALFLLKGPRYETGDTRVMGATCDKPASPMPIDCAPGEALVAKERAYGPFVLWVPGASVSYTF